VAFLPSLPGGAGWAALILPGGYLVLVTVLALVAALSRRPSRRDAAYRVLELIWWRRQPRDEPADTDPAPAALPSGRRQRRRR
jgi:hypothetical protein